MMKAGRPKLLLTTHIERFADCFEEMQALNVEHYNEISEHKKHGIQLDPDYAKYFARENAGELLYITLRHKGELVGYYIAFIGTALHYKSIIQCALDIIYVGKLVRGQNGGFLLLNAVLIEAKRRGVRLMTGGYKEAHKGHMKKLYSDCGMYLFEGHYAIWFD